MTNSQHQSI